MLTKGYGRAFGALAGAAALVATAACNPAASNAATAPVGAFGASGGSLMPASTRGGGGMTTFTDPTEHAFTVSVPRGWTVKSGVQRQGPLTVRPWLTATSPDGATTIALGDPSVPNFTLPGQGHAAGATVQTATGPSPVEPYENGTQFAADYAQRAWGRACQLQPAGTQAEPALTQEAQSQAARQAAAVGAKMPPRAFDGGSARFTCQAGGAAKAFGVIDVTSESAFQYAGAWNVSLLVAYSTPAASLAQTDQVARAMHQSYQVNPQWEAQLEAAARPQFAAGQQQDRANTAALTAQGERNSAMLRAQGQADQARLTANHNAFMQQQASQEASRNAAFGQQMYNKETGQQAEMRYINNQTCIRWADAAHTRCTATAGN